MLLDSGFWNRRLPTSLQFYFSDRDLFATNCSLRVRTAACSTAATSKSGMLRKRRPTIAMTASTAEESAAQHGHRAFAVDYSRYAELVVGIDRLAETAHGDASGRIGYGSGLAPP